MQVLGFSLTLDFMPTAIALARHRTQCQWQYYFAATFGVKIAFPILEKRILFLRINLAVRKLSLQFVLRAKLIGRQKSCTYSIQECGC